MHFDSEFGYILFCSVLNFMINVFLCFFSLFLITVVFFLSCMPLFRAISSSRYFLYMPLNHSFVNQAVIAYGNSWKSTHLSLVTKYVVGIEIEILFMIFMQSKIFNRKCMFDF